MRALLSVSDKANLVDFARGLAGRGYELVSTGGTARALAEAGLTVTAVSTVTGFPEMMDGRIKTLHPAVHGGILARRDRPDDMKAIEAQGIHPIDVVVVNLYPFARAAADPGLRLGSAQSSRCDVVPRPRTDLDGALTLEPFVGGDGGAGADPEPSTQLPDGRKFVAGLQYPVLNLGLEGLCDLDVERAWGPRCGFHLY